MAQADREENEGSGGGRTAAVFALDVWKEAGREVALSVDGNSMLPLVEPGNQVVLRLLEPHELRPGEIFAFLAGTKVMVHRLVKKREVAEGWWFCEAGDNLAGWQWLPEGKVLGRVLWIQGAYGVVKLDARPWTWVNSIFGLMIAFSVTVYEDFQGAKLPVFLQQSAWMLHRMSKKVLRIVNKLLLVRRPFISAESAHAELPFVLQSREGKAIVRSRLF